MSILTYLSPELINLTIGTSFESLLREIQEESANVSIIAPFYDFDQSVPFNGLRTFLKITQKYFYEVHSFLLLYKREKYFNHNKGKEIFNNNNNNNNNKINFEANNNINYFIANKEYDLHLEEHVKRHKNISHSKFDQIFKDLVRIGKFLLIHFHMVKLKHESSKLTYSDDEDEFGDPYHQSINEILFNINSENFDQFYNSDIALFWFCDFKRKIFTGIQMLKMFISKPVKTSITSLLDSEVRQNALFASAYDLSLKHILSISSYLTDSRVLTMLFSTYSLIRTCKFEFLEVKRQKSYGLSSSGQLMKTYAPHLENQRSTVNCLYIHDVTKDALGTSGNKQLIIHVHGSGFITANSEIHSIYIESWSKRLGIPVIIPNYSKAPQKPFPHALQDILDVYLFFTSDSNKDAVKKMLGFIPEKILLLGDSAGGNISLALMVTLNELNREREFKNEPLIQIPIGIALLYPCASPVVSHSFSRLLATLDPVLNLSIACAMSTAYLFPSGLIEEFTWEEKPCDHIMHAFWQIRKFRLNPFVSPMKYAHLDDFKHVPLYIQAAEFDILLDDSIDIAKSWKGPVKLKIAPDACHGFVMFQGPDIRKYIDMLLSFISECFVQ